MGQGSNAMLGFKSFENEYFEKVYDMLAEIPAPEYGGQSIWPLEIAMIGPKACLDLQISVCEKKGLLLRTEFRSLTGQKSIKDIYY
jgi:hypothetical protein